MVIYTRVTIFKQPKSSNDGSGFFGMDIIMFKKILLAIDGSDNARRAAESAIGLFKLIDGASLIITYISPNPPSQTRLVKADFDVHSLLIEDAKTISKNTLEMLKESGVDYELEVAIGDPATEILKIREKVNAGLIIVGSRGLGSLSGVVLGSVSQKIAHHAHCPVMIVK